MNTQPAINSALAIYTKPSHVRGARTKYTAEQKAQALALVAQGRTQSSVAREQGIVPNTLNSWVIAGRAADKSASPVVSLRNELLALELSVSRRLDALNQEREALTRTLAGVRAAMEL